MGNYRQHLTFSSVLGIGYAWCIYALAGLHWIYGVVAGLLTAISGLLPDIDHPMGVEIKGLTSTLGLVAALAAWRRLSLNHPGINFEIHLTFVVGVYLFARFGMRRLISRLMVHRGISHSFPTCAVWATLAYLHYPSDNQLVRIAMSLAVTAGFLSHLLLDECFSVDIANHQVKRSFGTAMKFWGKSTWATLGIYGLLGYLVWQAVEVWPDEPLSKVLADRPGQPNWPWHLPDFVKTRLAEAGLGGGRSVR